MDKYRRLHKWFNGLARYQFPFNSRLNEIPRNGIYVIFEKGEKFLGMDRIVRVGTHTGENQLHSRLKQHFLKENKDRSIFRKNIGRCFLKQDGSTYLDLWNLDSTSKKDRIENMGLIDVELEKTLEKRITEYVQTNLSFTVFSVANKTDRLCWESRLASTLAAHDDIRPSENWLGLNSPKEKIRNHGLWQVNELQNTILSDEEMSTLEIILLKRVR
jgi:hypothetical protein